LTATATATWPQTCDDVGASTATSHVAVNDHDHVNDRVNVNVNV
jgi:hypothetical protein